MSNKDKIVTELYRQEGDNSRFVMARVEKGAFTIDTQDMGPLVKKMWGDGDYEFWTTVPKEAWGDLLMALTKEMFTGDQRATDKLRDICKKHGVPHSWDSWA